MTMSGINLWSITGFSSYVLNGCLKANVKQNLLCQLKISSWGQTASNRAFCKYLSRRTSWQEQPQRWELAPAAVSHCIRLGPLLLLTSVCHRAKSLWLGHLITQTLSTGVHLPLSLIMNMPIYFLSLQAYKDGILYFTKTHTHTRENNYLRICVWQVNGKNEVPSSLCQGQRVTNWVQTFF